MTTYKGLRGLASAMGPLLLGLVLTGCIPLNIETPLSDGVGKTYGNFEGALAAQTLAFDKVKITWTPSDDPEVIAYNIYDTRNLFTPRLLKTVPVPASSVTLTGLEAQSLYTLRVRAANKKAIEDKNTRDVAAIPYGGVASYNVLSSTAATLVFNDASDADAIKIYCKVGSSTTWTYMKTVTNVSLTQTNLNGLTAGTLYTCRAALVVGDTEDNNTQSITFTPIGQATELVFATQPGSANAGQAFSPQPVVHIKDVNGNIVSAGPDANALITLSIAGNSPTTGTIRGTISVAAVAGVATFNSLNMQETGIKVLTATKADTASQTYGSGPLNVSSNQFTISPGPVSPTLSSIAISPASGTVVANGSSSYTVTIQLKDQYGNPITGTKPQFNSTNSADSLTQPTANTDVTGSTSGSFNSTVAGTRTIAISSPAGLTSNSIPVVFIPGPATKVAFVTPPVNSPAGVGTLNSLQVGIVDVQGNTVTSSSANVTLAIFVNPSSAAMTGTLTQAAVNGVATFAGLGIDKTGTGFKLVANSAPLAVAYSNSFNVTAGVPSKIAITGPAAVLSGTCSAAYVVQLQDAGGNPANASATTGISIAGLGSGAFYASSACAGAPSAATLSFASGSNSKTLYFKDPVAQALTITASDPSGVMTAATKSVSSTPSQIALSGPASVVSGQCSTAFTLTVAGANGAAGPVAVDTPFQINGLTSMKAQFYEASDCTGTALNSLGVNAPAVTVLAGNQTKTIYMKDAKAETLSVSVLDGAGAITTSSANLSVVVTASSIQFSGPATVVSGLCSTVYSVSLRDALGNLVPAPAQTTLNLNGLTGTQGAFYASSACAGAPLGTSFSVAQNASGANLYFRDSTAETLTVYVSDPAGKLTRSADVSIGVSPSAYAWTLPVAAQAKTNVCVGPFILKTMDGANNPTAAITPVTALLSGGGATGTYYVDSNCTSAVSSITFNSGVGSQDLYFRAYYPEVLTVTATDQGAVLQPATATWTVTAAPAWIGTGGGELSWFEVGKSPLTPRKDSPTGSYSLHMDSTKHYLYSVDFNAHRIIKYDYQTHEYIGWIGGFSAGGAIGVEGSKINPLLNAQCATLANGAQTPGWCFGGQSYANGNQAGGNFYNPLQLTDDGDYIYVTNYNGHSVTRYHADTGTFAGWIGWMTSRPTASGDGTINNCADTSAAIPRVSPGWCMGGATGSNGNYGDGRMIYPRSIAHSATNGGAGGGPYIYVSQRGWIARYNAASGAFAGWIGMILSGSTCGTANQRTPSWCMDGTPWQVNPANHNGVAGGINEPGGIYIDDANNLLYTVHTDNAGTFGKYTLSTGAFLGNFKVGGFHSPSGITYDNGYFYIADNRRMVQMDTSGNIWGWQGKVENNAAMSGPGCSTLVPNSDTPGWCLGGTAKVGIGQLSHYTLTAIESDGNGHLLTGSYNYPAIKRWVTATGAYDGQLIMASNSPARWSNSQNFADNQGFDDRSMYAPYGTYSDGTHLYQAELSSARIKKIDLLTGETVGWVGGITSSPTGGSAGCAGATPMSLAPGWCLGATFNPDYLWGQMIAGTVNGIMYQPTGIAGDATYIYVTDQAYHRILKFNKATGAFIGWIGAIGTQPTGGAAGCNGATGFTPGWCTGGTPSGATQVALGGMYTPTAITLMGGKLYVVDYNNYRIAKYDAATGAYNGWMGRINVRPTDGGLGENNVAACTGSDGDPSKVTPGFCRGGQATWNTTFTGSWTTGGGGVGYGPQNFLGLTNDGTNFYLANGHHSRIDKFNAAGVFQQTFQMNWQNYVNGWQATSPWGWTGNWSAGIWTDGTHLYATGNGALVAKFNLANGKAVGWFGKINPGQSPTGGAPGCSGATGITPGFCEGGNHTAGYTLGGFTGAAYGITGDANFVYVTDANSHRVTRIPK